MSRDEEGSLLDGEEIARLEAISVLYEVAKEIPCGKEQKHVSVTSRDESGRPVYQASLEFRGKWKRPRSIG